MQFSFRSRVVLEQAARNTTRLSRGEIGSAHLLIALASDGEKETVQLFSEARLTSESIYREMLGSSLSETGERQGMDLPYSDVVQAIFASAGREAVSLGLREISPAALLLGLLRHESGDAAAVLTALGHPPHALLRRLDFLVGRSPFGVSLTRAAEEGRLAPVIGREHEIGRSIQILSRRHRNNLVLIGEQGVGKGSVVNGIAEVLVNGGQAVPPSLREKQLFLIDWHALLAGREDNFHDRLRSLFETAAGSGSVILCIKNADRYLDLDPRTVPGNVSSVFWSLVSQGRLQIIITMYPKDFRSFGVAGSTFGTHCQPIPVTEPTLVQTTQILDGVQADYEAHHQVTIAADALSAVAALADRYITEKFLPAKAIDLLDEVAAWKRIRSEGATSDVVVDEAAVVEAVAFVTGIPAQEIHVSSERAEDERAHALERPTARLPHRSRSTAILIGTSAYDDTAIDDIASIANNISDLKDRLTDGNHGAFETPRVHEFLNPDLTDIPRMAEAAESAEDTLLVYYAGHGFSEPDGQLYLGLKGTEINRKKHSTLPYNQLRALVLDSHAKNRLVVLDCCYAGRAIDTLSADDGPSGQLDVSGSYILTATSATRLAHAPDGARNSAFTAALLSLLKQGVENEDDYIRIVELFPHLRSLLIARGQPEPQQRGTDTIGDLAIARNPYAARRG